jgi:3',5'-nucleoside bisphosphate phosphatase
MDAPHVRPDFDLQSHSLHSDGALAPAAVVGLAADQGMRLVALTDHDTVDGVQEALRAGAERGLGCSPAAELSAVDGDFEDLHVLGYELRHDDSELRVTLADFRADRGRRIFAMADRLEELGFALDRAELLARERAGAPLGRPHLADAVLRHPDNAARLRDEGIAGKAELFPPYLVPGARAYVARSRPTVAQAIEVIHAAGGVAVWAHPFWDVEDPETALTTLERFAAAGLDGVECFYATHSEEQTRLLHDAAGRLGLLTTGSTDFHGPEHETFSRFGGFELYGLEPDLGPIGQGAI